MPSKEMGRQVLVLEKTFYLGFLFIWTQDSVGQRRHKHVTINYTALLHITS